MEYYTVKPPESSKIDEALRDFLDGTLDPLLQTDQGSPPIKFLYKYFGPGSVANELNKVITRQDGFFFLDGVQIIADSGPKAEIAAALTLALRAAVLGIFGATTLPIAIEVVLAGAAAAGARWVYQSFVQPVLGQFFEVFGAASTRLEITDSFGQSVTCVVYRNGLAAEGKSSIDAALSLLNFSAGEFNVNSHVAVYINGRDDESTGYDVLSGNHLVQIAGALGVATTIIANGSGLNADGVRRKARPHAPSLSSPKSPSRTEQLFRADDKTANEHMCATQMEQRRAGKCILARRGRGVTIRFTPI
ncbi:hypothetical protein ABIB06_001033 [Bradyrhizobium sp. LB8.2]|uniref:hypothetical protein n=1 Tax=unclassified Bradyrhizobium TaxID=2631580 RepID=UPI00339A1BF5